MRIAQALVLALGLMGADAGTGLSEVKGRAASIDKVNRRLTLERARETPLTLQLDKATSVFINGQYGKLEEIQSGSEVRASFEPKQGQNKAQWIEVTRAKSDAPSTPAPEAQSQK